MLRIIILSIFVIVLQAYCYAQSENVVSDSKSEQIESELKKKKAELEVVSLKMGFRDKTRLMADIGHMCDYLGRYDEALMYYYQSISLRDAKIDAKLPFGHSNPWLLVDVGNVFYKLNSISKAIEIYNLAYSYFVNENNVDGKITTLNNLGMSYMKQGASERALEYFNSSKKLGNTHKNPYIVALINLYIGDALIQLNRGKEAISHYQSSVNYFISTRDTSNLSYSMLNLAEAYRDIKKPDSTLVQCRTIKTILANRMQNPIYGQAVATEAEVMYEQGLSAAALDTAIRYLFSNNDFKVSYLLAFSINYDSAFSAPRGRLLILDNTSRRNLYFTAYRCSKNLGNTTDALQYHELYSALRDSMQLAAMNTINKNQEYNIKSLQLLHNIDILNEKEFQLRLDRNYNRNLTYYLLFAALLLLIVVISNRKRFSYRYSMLVEYIKGLAREQQLLLYLIFAVYSILFFWLFRPAIANEEFTFIHKLIPGILVFLAVTISIDLLRRISIARLKTKQTLENNPYVIFVLVFFLSYIFQISHYTYLVKDVPPLNYFFSVTLLLLAAFILPFNVFIIFIENFVLKKILENVTEMSKELKEITPAEKGVEKVTFRSLRTSDSLVIDPANLLGVEAQGNYCRFFYLEDNVVRQTMVLIAIKRAESILEGNDRFVRCHNSYIVNVDYVVKVSGNSRGYQLKMLNTDEIFYVSRARQSYLMERIKHIVSIKV